MSREVQRSTDHDQPESTRSPSPAAVVVPWLIGVGGFVLVRYRGQSPAFMALHTRMKEAGLPDEVRHYDSLLLYVLIALLGSWAVARFRNGSVLRQLSLHRGRASWRRMVLVALLPMVAGGAAWAAAFGAELGTPLQMLARISAGVLRPALGEELIFRGLLVGVPAVALGWSGRGFWSVALLASLCFGAIHAPWDARFPESWPAILVTFAGGLWYCWLLASWRTLAVPIALHAGMNLGWMLIGATGGAGGGSLLANLLRVATIVIGTVWTLRMRRGVSESERAD